MTTQHIDLSLVEEKVLPQIFHEVISELVKRGTHRQALEILLAEDEGCFTELLSMAEDVDENQVKEN